METYTVTKMTYQEFEDILKKATNCEIEAVAEFEWNNDSCYATTVGPNQLVLDHEKEDWDKLKEDGEIQLCQGFPQIMQGLYQDGHLPAGAYIVEVSW